MSSGTARPFDAIRRLVADMPGPDHAAAAAVKARNARLTKPLGSLGRLEDMAEWLASWQGRAQPRIERPLVAVFAGNHGVAAKGVSAYPSAVTKQMVANFQAGGAAINQLCTTFGLGLKVFELALDEPTGDITEVPAMSEKDCAAAIAYGMEAVEGQPGLLCIGEMGIGNTTIAAALCYGLFGGSAREWVGPGTGVDEAGFQRKLLAVSRAVALHRDSLGDPLETLRRLGGRELAAMVGAIIAARHTRVPVIVDGYVVTAAAAVLYAISPRALDHCLAAHCSAEPAHRRLLERLGKAPLLDLGLRLGEASGAALAAGLVKAAADLHAGMATFESAGVSDRDASTA
jgi:nicotinate-nucleotide--dimethylbenzimidazole phosphoribosyltransferase